MNRTWYLFGFKGRPQPRQILAVGAGHPVNSCWPLCGRSILTLMELRGGRHEHPHGKGTVSFGFNVDDIFLVFDPAAWRALSLAKLPLCWSRRSAWVVILWMFIATSVKRLHDRDRSGWCWCRSLRPLSLRSILGLLPWRIFSMLVLGGDHVRAEDLGLCRTVPCAAPNGPPLRP